MSSEFSSPFKHIFLPYLPFQTRRILKRADRADCARCMTMTGYQATVDFDCPSWSISTRKDYAEQTLAVQAHESYENKQLREI